MKTLTLSPRLISALRDVGFLSSLAVLLWQLYCGLFPRGEIGLVGEFSGPLFLMALSVQFALWFPVLKRLRRKTRIGLTVIGLIPLFYCLVLFCVAVWFPPFGGKPQATLLLLGTDRAVNGKARSDVMLLVRVQLAPKRRVVLVSLPRDTCVRLPGMVGYEKINSAYEFGGEALAKKMVAETFGVRPDYTITVDTAGVAHIIDALGGVEATVPKPMRLHNYDENRYITLPEGKQHLNGVATVTLLRYRSDGLGNSARMERQKAFLREIAPQVLTPETLLRLPLVAYALQTSVKSDLSATQLIGLGWQLRNLPSSAWSTRQINGHSEFRYSARFRKNLNYFINETPEGERLFDSEADTRKTGSLRQLAAPMAQRVLNLSTEWIPENHRNRPGRKFVPAFITIHNTAATGKNADATGMSQYVRSQRGEAAQVSWHFTVDDKRCIQHLPLDEIGFHARSGNYNSLGIEICEYEGIDTRKAIDRAARLTAFLIQELNIPPENIVPHQFWMDKNCPRVILSQPGGFAAFRRLSAKYAKEQKH